MHQGSYTLRRTRMVGSRLSWFSGKRQHSRKWGRVMIRLDSDVCCLVAFSSKIFQILFDLKFPSVDYNFFFQISFCGKLYIYLFQVNKCNNVLIAVIPLLYLSLDYSYCCVVFQEGMRLYYVCTQPNCIHRWTE